MNGLIDGLSSEDYHGHKTSLSSTGARQLLPPSCPAKFRWQQDNGQEPKDAYDFGHVAHALVLGEGEGYKVLDFPDRRSKAARDAIAEARAEGLVPILAGAFNVALAMADVIREHPVASKLFSNGKPEQSAFWTDPVTGVQLRTRFDWLPTPVAVETLVVPDYKTAQSAEPGKWVRSAADYGYHQQAAWYLDTLPHIGFDGPAKFQFVVQEKTAPYLVTVIELDEMALRIGRARNRQAIDLYARCVTTDTWPGYATDVVETSLPTWAEIQYMDEFITADIEV